MRRSAVRWGLLALFSDGPKYGYQLRTEFDARTGGTWALNIGQVYTTLERLSRDGLVTPTGANEEGRTLYAITTAGRQALAGWFAAPVTDEDRPRSEIAIKLIMAATTPGVEIAAVVQAQRVECLRQIQDYTNLRRRADPDRDMAWLLLLDHLLFAVEAEVRWLDHMEATVLRRSLRSGVRATGATGATTTDAIETASAEVTR